jgi:hypothetical protein
MHELLARKLGAPAPPKTAPKPDISIPASQPLSTPPAKLPEPAPVASPPAKLPEAAPPVAAVVAPKPEPAPAAELLASLPLPEIAVPAPEPAKPMPAPASPKADLDAGQDSFALSIGFEEESTPKKAERALPIADQASLDAAVCASAEKYIREQLAAQLQTLTADALRQRLEHLTPSLDTVSGQLKQRIAGESERIAKEYGDQLKHSLAKDLEDAKAQASSSAIILERLREQAAKEIAAQKAELNDWTLTSQKSIARDAAAAAEDSANRIRAQMELEFHAKLAGAQNALDAKFEESKKGFADLVRQAEGCRAAGLASLAEVGNAHAQLDLLRQSVKTEMGMADSRLGSAIQEAMTRLSGVAEIRIAAGVKQVDIELQSRLAAFRQSVTHELEAVRERDVVGLAAQCNELVARAGQNLEASAAKVLQAEAAAAAVLANVDASLSRSTQSMDALHQLQASITSTVQQKLATDSKSLFLEFQRQLNEQCKRLVTTHLAALEKQVAQQMQAAGQTLERLAEEKSDAEAACRVYGDTLQEQAKKSMEDFRSSITQTTERLKSELETATRLAHETLEQDFSSKLKYIADNTTNLVRKLFQSASESKPE